MTATQEPTAHRHPDRPRPVLLPDPKPQERTYPIISVDDHLKEPRDVFEGRIPPKFADRAPTVIDLPNGDETWLYESSLLFEHGFGSTSGIDIDSWREQPYRYDEVRPGVWDINERVTDMDLDGVYSHMCFPSGACGFAGRVFAQARDSELDSPHCAPTTSGTSRFWPARTRDESSQCNSFG